MVYIEKKLTANPSICQGIQARIPNQTPDFFTFETRITKNICEYMLKKNSVSIA